jgi:hypothetical protein
MFRRSLQLPNKAFYTKMPNLIPYFIAALKDYKYKDKLYIIIIEIKKA